MVGLLGVAVAMLSIGLATVALDDNNDITILAYIPFSIAALFFVLFFGAWFYLAKHASDAGNKISEIRKHIRSGLDLRTNILNKVVVGDAKLEQALQGWHDSVAKWIEAEEPDYISDFEAAAPGIMRGLTNLDIGSQASFFVHVIDAKLGALKGLLSDLRVSR